MDLPLFSQPIVSSLLDLDAYKINMMQAIHSFYPDTQVRYELIVRSNEDLTRLLWEIRDEIKNLSHLGFSEQDIAYLRAHCPYLKPSFLNTLRYFRFNPDQQIELGIVEEKHKRQLRIGIKGTWKDTILYETIVMAIVSEVRSRQDWRDVSMNQVIDVFKAKVKYLKSELRRRHITNFKLTEMGTRRRFSINAQREIIRYMTQEMPELLQGTSNLEFAKEFNLTPIGTIAHEWFMGHQAIANIGEFQKVALKRWLEAFDGKLSIAPTDTLTIDAFLHDFDIHLAKAFDGVRHDSGCPYVWGDKLIAHYKKLGIDPKTKVFVFSNGLNFDEALDISEYFNGRVNVSFGIGTFLTNDLGNCENSKGEHYQPLSIVVKLTECNGQPVAKISDEPEKAMCEDAIYLANLKRHYKIDLDIDHLINELEKMQTSQRIYIAAA